MKIMEEMKEIYEIRSCIETSAMIPKSTQSL